VGVVALLKVEAMASRKLGGEF